MQIRHPRRWACWIVCVAVTTCASCLSGSDDPADQIGSIPQLRGTWQGSTSAGEAVELVLSQELVEVTGTAVIGTFDGPLTGTIDGKRLEATVASESIRQIFASVQGDTMSGTVRDIRGSILSSFDARRQ